MDFDYRTATEDEILRRGALLEGSRVGQIPGASFAAAEARRGKGEVGLALEAFFGIPPNPISDADFPGAHIELKAVPVVDTTRGARIKERTFISAINYETLALEDWATASVRKKLHILFVFYEHLRGQPKADFPIQGVLLWRPDDDIEEQISRDWMTVRGKILAGLAHELSEADGRILGPATKGADSSVLRRQPHSSVLAPSRAFALKPAFTFSLYVEPSRARLESAELAENASLVELRRRFGRFIGLSIDAAADALGIRRHRGKGYAGQVIQAAVRASSPLVESDFVVIGPTVRMTRVNGESYPYEALSFPRSAISMLLRRRGKTVSCSLSDRKSVV